MAMAALRRELPDAKRPFKVPFGDVIPFLAFFASNLIVYWAGWDVDWKLFVGILLGFVLLGAYAMFRRGELPNMDWKAGASWTLPWLGGLALISYLGSYPDPADGNRGVIGFGWGFVAIFALTALVWTIAHFVRLPRNRVQEHVEQTLVEAEAEKDKLASEH
jgi:amino acid transporter